MKEQVRQELVEFLEKYGSSCAFVAKKTGMARETINRFKNGETDILRENYCLKIKEFLDSLK